MPRVHLTDVVVSGLKTAATYYDEKTPAFGLRVGKTKKTWFVVRGREQLRTNIGQYPIVSLADARKEARRLLTEKPTLGDRTTFNEAYEPFKVALASRKERTQYDYKRVLWRRSSERFGGPKRSGENDTRAHHYVRRGVLTHAFE